MQCNVKNKQPGKAIWSKGRNLNDTETEVKEPQTEGAAKHTSVHRAHTVL